VNTHPTLLQEVFEVVQHGLAQPRALAQIVVIAVAVGAGWLLARRVRSRVNARLADEGGGRLPPDVLRFSVEGFRRLAFPVAALLFVGIGALLLRGLDVAPRIADLKLMRLALTLLGAMALIRLGVYGLRRALPTSAWLTSFERWIALSVWLGVALYLSGLWGDAQQALEAVRFPVGRAQISLWDLLMGAVSVLVTVIAALWLASSVEARLMRAPSLTANSRVVLVRIVKALLLVVAVLIALSSVGIDLTVLSVFGGALGVGLGLGLQRIASNYVSGFIILLDRSLSIGDMITVDKYYGRVAKIETRYTVVQALDGTETILPNEMLVSTPVVNHSLSTREVRVTLKVAVAYGTDTDRALALLVDCVHAQPRVLQKPAPGAFIANLGTDGIELELGFWIKDPEEGTLAVRSAIAQEVLRRFAAAGIVIPFAQRDVRILAMPSDGAARELP
jgi:small-conductance mechanosensitive channel